MKQVVYTAIFGNYDKLKELKFSPGNIEYICFTDNIRLKSKTWKVVYIKNNENGTFSNRKTKINVLDYLSEYDQSIYIDGNIQVLNNLKELFNELEDYPIAAIKHRTRQCIYKEAEQCLKIGKSGCEIINQVEVYRNEGFPENYGLTENCIILRNHRHPDLKLILDHWWEQFYSGIKRDQISLPYIRWKYNVNLKEINLNPRKPNPYLRWWQHSNKYTGVKKLLYRIKNSYFNKEWRKVILQGRRE